MAESLSKTFKDKDDVHLAYMPFVEYGGMFIETEDSYSLGDTVNASITLPDNPDPVSFSGVVIWITPKVSSSHDKPGVGIQLKEAKEVLKRIEVILGTQQSSKPTDTL